MNIRRDEIGSLKWCDQYVDQLDDIISKSLAGDDDAQLILVNCAAHFYGLSIFDFGGFKRDIPALTAAVARPEVIGVISYTSSRPIAGFDV